MLKLCFLIVWCHCILFTSATVMYQTVLQNKCINPAKAFASLKLINEFICAIQCSKITTCSSYHIWNAYNVCQLFNATTYADLAAQTTSSLGTCTIRTSLQLPNFQVFTSNGQYTVPVGVTSLRVLAVGGGAGGQAKYGGGSGSGFVVIAKINVTTGQTFDVIVGSGGNGSTNPNISATGGRNSSFGSLVVAMGGMPALLGSLDGGNGGSGGGAGSSYPTNISGNGGSGGVNGTKGWSRNFGGQGQGKWNFTAIQFKYANFSAGAGGNGSFNVYCIVGGGGGGGVLLNGSGPKSGSLKCCYTTCSHTSSSGYGAGGGAGSFYFPSNSVNPGGSGAPGLVYVEY